MRTLSIATRNSPLARWQAEWVQARLGQLGYQTKLVPLTSEGDVNLRPIDGTQGVGLFTKTIQRAVLDQTADIAVHSLKDLPTQIDTGLILAAVPEREDVADCLISKHGPHLSDLPEGARVGTGSRRRAAQLLHQRPDLQVTPIRGNVQTRLSFVETPEFDAVVLARAGLLRLELVQHTANPLPLEVMLPAPGQGALGIEARPDDTDCLKALAGLNDLNTHLCVLAERSLLRELKAGCLAPVGGIATIEDDRLTLRAVVLSTDGRQRLYAEHSLSSATIEKAEVLGEIVAENLRKQGADVLVAAAH